MSISARAPTRIDFGGGWTDVPPYCDREGGFVCNVAISRYATATAESGAQAKGGRDEQLVSAAVRRSGLTDVRVNVESDFPVGAGLGGSSSASAAIRGALLAWKEEPWDLREIAEAGRVIEVEDLGVAGGRQDHYAATHGGALGLTFTDTVHVDRLTLSDAARAEFERRALLVYTGQSRISGDTITAVIGAYLERDRRVTSALREMKRVATEMAPALERGDFDHLAQLVEEHWASQRALNDAIPTALIDEIIERARKAGAHGSKALGASGGGCVLVIAGEENVVGVRRAVETLGTLLDFAVDLGGLARVEI